MNKKYTKTDILKALDESAKKGKFPVLDNENVYLADARLSVFCSQEHWLFVFEIVGYSAPENEFVDHIYLIGNCVDQGAKIVERIFIEETDDDPVWDREEGEWLADWRNWEIMVKGKIYKFRPSLDEYKEAGIEIEDPKRKIGSLRQDMLIRFLSFKLGDKLFCTEDELFDIIPKNDLKKVFYFKEWQHPDIKNNENPSEIPFFISLTSAIESGERSIPEEAIKNPNTHWSNWIVKWY